MAQHATDMESDSRLPTNARKKRLKCMKKICMLALAMAGLLAITVGFSFVVLSIFKIRVVEDIPSDIRLPMLFGCLLFLTGIILMLVYLGLCCCKPRSSNSRTSRRTVTEFPPSPHPHHRLASTTSPVSVLSTSRAAAMSSSTSDVIRVASSNATVSPSAPALYNPRIRPQSALYDPRTRPQSTLYNPPTRPQSALYNPPTHPQYKADDKPPSYTELFGDT